jgi:hypothetical protein
VEWLIHEEFGQHLLGTAKTPVFGGQFSERSANDQEWRWLISASHARVSDVRTAVSGTKDAADVAANFWRKCSRRTTGPSEWISVTGAASDLSIGTMRGTEPGLR